MVLHPRDPGSTPTLEELQEHCRAHIAGYKLPRQLLVVEAIPLTASGKPDSKAAKALF